MKWVYILVKLLNSYQKVVLDQTKTLPKMIKTNLGSGIVYQHLQVGVPIKL